MTSADPTAPLRPADYRDPNDTGNDRTPPIAPAPRLGPVGQVRAGWRLLTSMRTALVLLALLAVASVPGSLVPQRVADPNGVIRFRRENPELFPILDALQLFDVYTSVWFSAIYLLLFVSLIGCIIPRTRHHLTALRRQPPRPPRTFARFPMTVEFMPVAAQDPDEVVDAARYALRRRGYRLRRPDPEAPGDVSAERGYLRETGNLVFHVAMLVILASIAVLHGFSFTGQAVVIEGTAFVSSRLDFDSFQAGRLFTDDQLPTYRMRLDDFAVDYVLDPGPDFGQPTGFAAHFTVDGHDGTQESTSLAVNQPADIASTRVFLLGNGYAPHLTVRDPAGTVVYSERVPFLPQDGALTSLGVIKIPDGLEQQIGFAGYLYPTVGTDADGARLVSAHPELLNPVVVLNVFAGDLGIDDGVPQSVYSLNTDDLTQLTGGTTRTESLTLAPGDTVELPGGLGSISVEVDDHPGGIARFVSIDVHRDLTRWPVLIAATIGALALIVSLLVPRRRVWVRVTDHAGRVCILLGGLTRGHDPRLAMAVEDVAAGIRIRLNGDRP